MRKDFSSFLHKEMALNKRIILITADLGDGLWDKIRMDYPDRFYNVMSSEQLMLGLSVGLAMDKYIPVCYSITPFLLYRPLEWIRNYMEAEKIPVKMVGGGRDKDYGHLGCSHWAEEDISILSVFKNIKTYKPETTTDALFLEFINNELPCYLNLKK